jgi:phosphate starvation-inducible PhoH-like protein
MSRSTLAVVNSKRLLELFGPRDQHLRKIRTALDVGISARDGEIHIEGEDAAVHKATQIFESLDQSLRTDGIITEQIVERLLNGNTASEKLMHQESIEVHRPGGRIVPRSTGQADYVRAIRQSDIVFCEGPAGCGKTFLAVAMAVSALREQHVTKIVLVRPAVEAGESLGFLPGDLQAKIDPYLRPLLDALREMMDFDLLKKLTEQDVIEMIPLAYMRGRTLNHAFVILDEAQNTTAAQMKMFLTRLGIGSKMVISGDTTQIDLPSNRKSGLVDAMERLGEVSGCHRISLGGGDIVRHPLVQRIVKAYEE